MIYRRTLILLTLFFSTLIQSIDTYAQDGSLDITFNVNGINTIDIGSSNNLGNSAVIQNDGKILVAGVSGNTGNTDFAIMRFNNDGTLDTSFDTNGIVTTDFGGSNDGGISISLQNDGKILVAGYTNNLTGNDFALVRYNTNGSLDSSFDLDGKVTTEIDGYGNSGFSVLLQGDGKILVAGSSNNGTSNRFALVRYNSNGSLDNSFDTDGKVTTSFGGYGSWGHSMALQSDGKILVGGYYDKGTEYDFAIARYNIDGSLDISFDNDGKVTTAIGAGDDIINSIIIQNDGKILGIGYSNNGTDDDWALVRYNNNGSLDNSFSIDGKITTAIGSSNDRAYSVVIQSDEKIVVTGSSRNSFKDDFALARYLSDGSLDTTFDNDGKVTTAIGSSNDYGKSIAIQNDGKIIVAGYSRNGTNDDFALARYNNSIMTSVLELKPMTKDLNFYPNPFENSTHIQFNFKINNAELTMYNFLGRKVRTIEGITGESITLYRDNLPNGLYYLLLTQKSKIISKGEILILN